MTGEKLKPFSVANLDIKYFYVCSSSRRRRDGVKGIDGGIVILDSYEFHCIIAHQTLV